MESTTIVQYKNYAGLLTSLQTFEEVLDDHASELVHDLIAYRNHVYRACDGIRMLPQERGLLLWKTVLRRSFVTVHIDLEAHQGGGI